jgi:MoaA/NifB/PqqE/SkfB family radical SAM enzyme
MYAAFRNLSNGARCLLGLYSGRYVLSGPRSFSLILSSECNSHCVMCWFHSPLLNPARAANNLNNQGGEAKPSFMDFRLCETIIREMHALGAARAVIAGWGEPALHPQIDRILELLVGLGIAPYVITNGLAIDADRARHWARLPVHFRFSLHAGDPETWLKIHPDCSIAQFELVNKVIRHLTGADKASASTMHAIQKANFRRIREMVEHARRTGVRRVLFLPVRAEGYLGSHVLLSGEEEKELQGELASALLLAKQVGIRTNLPEYMASNRYMRNGVPDTAALYNRIPCYVGWIYSEFDIDGTMRPCEGSRIVLGKAGNSRIRMMWRSQTYRQFREEGRYLPSRRKDVSGCPCRTCSMAKFNLNVYNLLHLKSIRYEED